MGIGMPLSLGEAEIKHPLGLTDGFIAKFQHRDRRFSTTTDELFNGDFQIQPIEHNEISLGQVLHIARRRLKGVRVHPFWHQAMHVQNVPSYLSDHIG